MNNKVCENFPCYIVELFKNNPELYKLIGTSGPEHCERPEDCQTAKLIKKFGKDYHPITELDWRDEVPSELELRLGCGAPMIDVTKLQRDDYVTR